MSDTPKLTLETICDGAAAERFEDALKQVVANMGDPNCEDDKKREITLTFTFEQDEIGALVRTWCDVKVKLAAPRTVPGVARMGVDQRTGEMDAVAILTRDPDNPKQTMIPLRKAEGDE